MIFLTNFCLSKDQLKENKFVSLSIFVGAKIFCLNKNTITHKIMHLSKIRTKYVYIIFIVFKKFTVLPKNYFKFACKLI